MLRAPDNHTTHRGTHRHSSDYFVAGIKPSHIKHPYRLRRNNDAFQRLWVSLTNRSHKRHVKNGGIKRWVGDHNLIDAVGPGETVSQEPGARRCRSTDRHGIARSVHRVLLDNEGCTLGFHQRRYEAGFHASQGVYFQR